MRISVALCTYNGEKYIDQQLDSIFSQSVAVSEIVVCDDCSSDATVLKVERASSLHPGVIKLIVNPRNIGFRENFENALKECQGDYIFFCDQDDIWNPDKVEKSVAYLQSSDNYGVFTDADLIDGNNKKINKTLFECLHVNRYINNIDLYPDLFTTLCLSDNFVTGATVAIKREAKSILLPSWPSDGLYHDYYIALKLSAVGRFGLLADRLIDYRIHTSQQTGVKIGSTDKNHIFDFEFDTDRYGCFQFLLRRRTGIIVIGSRCNFDNGIKRKIKDSYRKYMHSIIKSFPFFLRMKAFFYFCKRELTAAVYPFLIRYWVAIHNWN